jgi:hypothetical protein
MQAKVSCVTINTHINVHALATQINPHKPNIFLTNHDTYNISIIIKLHILKMSSNRYYFSIFFHTLVFAALATTAFSTLSSNYYDYTCPNALSTIRSVVKAAVQKENRMGASLLRLHFHDCFVNVRSSNSMYLFQKKIFLFF